jgi:putative sigma-54 modulation protein
MKATNGTGGRVDVTVKGNHLVVTQALRDAVVQKMGNLDRYFSRLQSIDVELCSEKTRESSLHNRVEATTHIAGRSIRVTASHEDMYAAIDDAVDKLHRSLNRLKERSTSHGGARILDVVATTETPQLDEERNLALRSGDSPVFTYERVEVQPLFEDDAIAELNEAGLSFYVFLNARSESVNVLYRHADGTYGIIEPRTS